MNLIGDKEVTCQSTGWKTASGTIPECTKSGKCETNLHYIARYCKNKITKLIYHSQGREN